MTLEDEVSVLNMCNGQQKHLLSFPKMSYHPEGSHKDTDKLAAEVAVKPAVEKWIGAGGRHTNQMTSGVYDDHLFFVFRTGERIVHIQDEIDDVQWQPSDGENEGDGYQ